MFKNSIILTFLAVACLSVNQKAHAIGDAVFLAQIAASTAGQLKELAELATQTKGIADQFSNVRTAIDEKIDFALRLESKAEDIKALEQVISADDLQDLVDKMKQLKSTVADTKEFVNDIKKEQAKIKLKEGKIDKKIRNRKRKKMLVGNRYNVAAKSGSVGSGVKSTAITNALMYEELYDINTITLEQNQTLNKLYMLETAKARRDFKMREAQRNQGGFFVRSNKKAEGLGKARADFYLNSKTK